MSTLDERQPHRLGEPTVTPVIATSAATQANESAPDGSLVTPGERPLTRIEAAAFLTDQGFRISYSTLTKMCSPAIDTGPESYGKFGRDSLYLPSVLLAWAKSRVFTQPPRRVTAETP